MLEKWLSDAILSQSVIHLECSTLPLAVYREVAAHLRQVEGVQVALIPQTSHSFNYLESQVGGMVLTCSDEMQDLARNQIIAILNHYHQRHQRLGWSLLRS